MYTSLCAYLFAIYISLYVVVVDDGYAPVGSKNGSKSNSKRHSTVLLIMSINQYSVTSSLLLVDWKHTFYLKLITRSVSVFFLI